jgi:hypothetical protein
VSCSRTLHFAIAKGKFSKSRKTLLKCIGGIDFLRLAEDERLEELGARALRHSKIQYFIQQLIHENKVQSELQGNT